MTLKDNYLSLLRCSKDLSVVLLKINLYMGRCLRRCRDSALSAIELKKGFGALVFYSKG